MRSLLFFSAVAIVYSQTVPGDHVIKVDTGVRAVAFSPNGTLSGMCADGKIRVWDVESGKLLKTLPVDEKARGFAFAQGADQFAVYASEKGLRLFDGKTGQVTRDMAPAEPRLGALSFSRDAATIAAGSRDKTVRLLDATPAGNGCRSRAVWAAYPHSRSHRTGPR